MEVFHYLLKDGVFFRKGTVNLTNAIQLTYPTRGNFLHGAPSFQARLYAIAAAIWRQDWAQRRQDWAQRLQWSLSCFSHSAAQRSQASAQTLHI